MLFFNFQNAKNNVIIFRIYRHIWRPWGSSVDARCTRQAAEHYVDTHCRSQPICTLSTRLPEHLFKYTTHTRCALDISQFLSSTCFANPENIIWFSKTFYITRGNKCETQLLVSLQESRATAGRTAHAMPLYIRIEFYNKSTIERLCMLNTATLSTRMHLTLKPARNTSNHV